MAADRRRLAAYYAALKAAVARAAAAKQQQQQQRQQQSELGISDERDAAVAAAVEVSVLDVGCGSGALSLLAVAAAKAVSLPATAPAAAVAATPAGSSAAVTALAGAADAPQGPAVPTGAALQLSQQLPQPLPEAAAAAVAACTPVTASVVGVELVAPLAAAALRNVALNGCGDAVSVVHGDAALLERGCQVPPRGVDVAVFDVFEAGEAPCTRRWHVFFLAGTLLLAAVATVSMARRSARWHHQRWMWSQHRCGIWRPFDASEVSCCGLCGGLWQFGCMLRAGAALLGARRRRGVFVCVLFVALSGGEHSGAWCVVCFVN